MLLTFETQGREESCLLSETTPALAILSVAETHFPGGCGLPRLLGDRPQNHGSRLIRVLRLSVAEAHRRRRDGKLGVLGSLGWR
jgi:hypothetical protein